MDERLHLWAQLAKLPLPATMERLRTTGIIPLKRVAAMSHNILQDK